MSSALSRWSATFSATVEPRVIRTKEVGIEQHPRDCMEIRYSGGGGWGPPDKRSAMARQRDREQGLTDVVAEQASS